MYVSTLHPIPSVNRDVKKTLTSRYHRLPLSLAPAAEAPQRHLGVPGYSPTRHHCLPGLFILPGPTADVECFQHPSSTRRRGALCPHGSPFTSDRRLSALPSCFGLAHRCRCHRRFPEPALNHGVTWTIPHVCPLLFNAPLDPRMPATYAEKFTRTPISYELFGPIWRNLVCRVSGAIRYLTVVSAVDMEVGIKTMGVVLVLMPYDWPRERTECGSLRIEGPVNSLRCAMSSRGPPS